MLLRIARMLQIALMKRAGVTFFDFTTKHHEGFSMYDTNTRVHDCWDFDLTPGAKHVKGIKACVPGSGGGGAAPGPACKGPACSRGFGFGFGLTMLVCQLHAATRTRCVVCRLGARACWMLIGLATRWSCPIHVASGKYTLVAQTKSTAPVTKSLSDVTVQSHSAWLLIRQKQRAGPHGGKVPTPGTA